MTSQTRGIRAGARLAILRLVGAGLCIVPPIRGCPPGRTRRRLARTRPPGGARAGCSTPPRVLLVRPDHLGDVLLAAPAGRLLSDALPGVVVDWLVGPWAANVVRRSGQAGNVLTCDFPGFTRRPKGMPWSPYLTLMAEATRLRACRYDAAIILRSDHWWGALLVALAGIPRRIGFDVPECRPFLTDALPRLDVPAFVSAIGGEAVQRQPGGMKRLNPADDDTVGEGLAPGRVVSSTSERSVDERWLSPDPPRNVARGRRHAVEQNQLLALFAARRLSELSPSPGSPSNCEDDSLVVVDPTFTIDDGERDWAASWLDRTGLRGRCLQDGLGPPNDTLPGDSVSRAPRSTHAAPSMQERGTVRPALVAIHPGSGAVIKNWPATRWQAVAQALRERVGARIVLTGGPGERDIVDAIQNGLDPPLPTLVGETTLGQLAALFARCDLVLGADSGPLHLAAAVGTPTVRIYGPTDPAIFGPRPAGPHQRALAASLPCQPCGNLIAPPCGATDTPACLLAIDADTVTRTAIDVLHLSGGAKDRLSAGHSLARHGDAAPGLSTTGHRVLRHPRTDSSGTTIARVDPDPTTADRSDSDSSGTDRSVRRPC